MLTMRIWDEAWAQYRHMETMRGQYLGFFFTAVLGVAAVAGPQLADDSTLSTSSALLTIATLATGLQILSGFLYVAVTRLNKVLAHYKTVMFNAAVAIATRTGEDLSPYSLPPEPTKPWASTNGVSKLVLRLGLIGFPLVLAGTFARAAEVTGMSVTTWLCGAALAIAVGAATLVHVEAGS